MAQTSLKETENYKLVVGTSVESGNPCYQVVNKNYGVVEVETYILSQAFSYIKQLEEALSGGGKLEKVPSGKSSISV